MNRIEDTIIALATPAGVGALAVVRISGSDAINTAAKLFIGKSDLNRADSHTVHYGRIGQDGEWIDEVLLSLFRAPTSYTGENSVEISCHGSPLIVQKIISLFVGKGIRPAEPGEFTRRAFMNGKLDLAQSEAVADMIHASSEAALRGARDQLNGALSAKVEQLRATLTESASLLELELDFSEEEIEFVSYEELAEKIKLIISQLDQLLSTYSFGKVIRDGVHVALVGQPNVGKSSLLNYLLKEARAIVSHIPGTTRDIIREELTIDGVLFILSDTAGMRTTDDIIEQEGVARSKQAIQEADLILCMGDVEQGINLDMLQDIFPADDERMITVLNKIDLDPSTSHKADVVISSETGEGIDTLLHLLQEKAIGSWNYSEHSAVVNNVRHFKMITDAKEALLEALNAIKQKMSNEFVAVDMRAALDALGKIIGQVSSDDLLNNIFAHFCIGK